MRDTEIRRGPQWEPCRGNQVKRLPGIMATGLLILPMRPPGTGPRWAGFPASSLPFWDTPEEPGSGGTGRNNVLDPVGPAEGGTRRAAPKIHITSETQVLFI